MGENFEGQGYTNLISVRTVAPPPNPKNKKKYYTFSLRKRPQGSKLEPTPFIGFFADIFRLNYWYFIRNIAILNFAIF